MEGFKLIESIITDMQNENDALIIANAWYKIYYEAKKNLDEITKSESGTSYLNLARREHIRHVAKYLEDEVKRKATVDVISYALLDSGNPTVHFCTYGKGSRITKLDAELQKELSYNAVIAYLGICTENSILTKEQYDLFMQKINEDETYPECMLTQTLSMLSEYK